MEPELTDEERLEQRRRERALCEKGFVRTTAVLANYAIQADVPMERGPKVTGSKTDQGLWVPAWFEWYMKRFATSIMHDNPRKRVEGAKELLEDKGKQLMLLYEAGLAGGTLYDPLGDISTKHAIDTLEKELKNEEGNTLLGQALGPEENDSEHRADD